MDDNQTFTNLPLPLLDSFPDLFEIFEKFWLHAYPLKCLHAARNPECFISTFELMGRFPAITSLEQIHASV